MGREWRKGASVEKGEHFAIFLLAPFLSKNYFLCIVEVPKSWTQLQTFAGNFSTRAVIDDKVNGLLAEEFEMSSWTNTVWRNIFLEWKVRRNEGWILQKQDSVGDGVACGLSQTSWHGKWFDTVENFKSDYRQWKNSGNQPQLRQQKRFYLKIIEGWLLAPSLQPISHPIWFCCSVLEFLFHLLSFGFSWSFPIIQLLWCLAVYTAWMKKTRN